MEEIELAAGGGGPVEIRVAAAEEDEEDPEEEEDEACRRGRLCLSPLGGGSCSEDDSGRGCGKSRMDGSKDTTRPAPFKLTRPCVLECSGKRAVGQELKDDPKDKPNGGENDGEDFGHNWTAPDRDLILKLVSQIEYYFSDENLEKDAFLLKHVRRNKMGYVSVKLLTSFKKVKTLTRDWRTTAYALKFSEVLELNEDNRKVRRNTPVPVFPSENLPSKMLLIYDIHTASDLHPEGERPVNGCVQEKTMENLLKAFVKFGVISSVRILKPGRDLPPDIKRFSSRYSQVGTKECAIVEFEEVDAAIKAHESMCRTDAEADMKVVLIGMKPPKKKVPKDKTREEDPRKGLAKTRSLNKRVEELQYVGDESSANSSSEPESDPTSPMSGRRSSASNKLSPTAYQNHHLSPNVSPRSSPWNSPSSLRKVSRVSPLAEDGRLSLSTSPETSRRCADYSSDSSITPSSSPWVQRRRQAQTLTQEKSPVGSPVPSSKIQNADGLPVGVLRLPRGPDGTKGFHNGAVVPPYAVSPDYSRNRPARLYVPSPIVDNRGHTRECIKHRGSMIIDTSHTSASGPLWEEKWIKYVTVVNSIKPWRTAGKPFVCDRLWLWTS